MLAAQEMAQLYQTAFVRSARAVGALWAVCSLCFTLLEVVVLAEPAWLVAEGVRGADGGTLGLFRSCVETGSPARCWGSVFRLRPLPPFETAASFVGTALGLGLASVLSLGLHRFCSNATLYKVCGWLQLSAASCQALGCLTFADGWGSEEVRELCGPAAAPFSPGRCALHWAFTLALIGIFDALVLSALAFVLASRQDTLLPENFSVTDKADSSLEKTQRRRTEPPHPHQMVRETPTEPLPTVCVHEDVLYHPRARP